VMGPIMDVIKRQWGTVEPDEAGGLVSQTSSQGINNRQQAPGVPDLGIQKRIQVKEKEKKSSAPLAIMIWG
jgi:hypothetical protein